MFLRSVGWVDAVEVMTMNPREEPRVEKSEAMDEADTANGERDEESAATEEQDGTEPADDEP